MALQPYQERVVAERQELAQRLEALGKFIQSDAWLTVPPEEQGRLGRQHYVMGLLLGILDERIANFA
jgi:hypothetical protein